MPTGSASSATPCKLPGIRISAWLVPIAFMTGQCRHDLHLRVTRTVTFAKRLPRMGRADYEGKTVGADDDFMWLIFDHANPGNGIAPNRYL